MNNIQSVPDLTIQTQFRIRYADTDKMGIVYYGKYLELFEIGRTEWIRTFWKSYAEIERDGYFLPVIQCYVKYQKSFEYDDLITIHCQPISFTNTRIQFYYNLFKQNECEVRVLGITEHVFLDHAKKIVRIPSLLTNQMKNKISDQVFLFPQFCKSSLVSTK
ncbi:MAG: acyl-CoA thioesterase [bacterium]|nr:acyl-CoA thioesterase [bacterium]